MNNEKLATRILAFTAAVLLLALLFVPAPVTGQEVVHSDDYIALTFPSNQEEYSRVGGKIYGRITDSFGLSGLFFTTLDGRNTGETDGFSVGVNFRL